MKNINKISLVQEIQRNVGLIKKNEECTKITIIQSVNMDENEFEVLIDEKNLLLKLNSKGNECYQELFQAIKKAVGNEEVEALYEKIDQKEFKKQYSKSDDLYSINMYIGKALLLKLIIMKQKGLCYCLALKPRMF